MALNADTRYAVALVCGREIVQVEGSSLRDEAAEALPAALHGVADGIFILYPWGSLLRVVTAQDVVALHAIARLGKPGASVHVRVNASAVEGQGFVRSPLCLALHHGNPWPGVASAYEHAGMRIVHWTQGPGCPPAAALQLP